MSADSSPRIRINALPGTVIPPWAGEVRWRLSDQADSLPEPVPGLAAGFQFEGRLPSESLCAGISDGAPVLVRVSGQAGAGILDLPRRELRITVAVDASDQELVRIVNVATGAGLPASITFANPADVQWDQLAECWQRFLHVQRNPVSVAPFAGFVTGAAQGVAFSLADQLLRNEVTELWCDEQGRLAATAGHAAGGRFLGTTGDNPGRLLADDWYVRAQKFHRNAFRDGAECSVCPGYRACGGYLALHGISDCADALPFFRTVVRDVSRLRRDLNALEREQSSRSRPPVRELTVLVSYRCVNECLFCAPADRRHAGMTIEDDEVLETIRSAAARGVKALSLSGAGEPTFCTSLERFAMEARDAGIESVSVFTNGHGLTGERIATLQDAGVTGFLVSVHGLEAEHDRITGRKGSFSDAAKALGLMAALEAHVTVNTCIVRDNLDQLEELARWVEETGRDAHTLSLPEWSGNGLRNTGRLARYAEVDEALQRVPPRPGLSVVNAPLCIGPDALGRQRSGPFLFRDAGGSRVVDSVMTHNRKPGICRKGGCSLLEECCGVDRNYLRLVGESEFSARCRR